MYSPHRLDFVVKLQIMNCVWTVFASDVMAIIQTRHNAGHLQIPQAIKSKFLVELLICVCMEIIGHAVFVK